ncbi:DUF1778 domain-containing protein [Parasutterella excrementihominis]|uniref:type II toxin-antitoxin system TacA family antitoxin n=1 Tax=Parasutterella excrementihominis TaxID=487175 RepID=UPI0035127662
MTRTMLERCEIQISSEEKTLLQLAASMAGLSLSVFIRKAAISEAKDSINKNNHHILSGQEAGELFSVIEKGFVPNERLKEAMKHAEKIENNGASHVF